MDNLVVIRPKESTENLCADKAYTGEPAKQAIESRGYISQAEQRGQKETLVSACRAHRWIVEVVHSWLNRFRKLLVRYEKFADSYEALVHLAFAIICWRKIGVIYG